MQRGEGCSATAEILGIKAGGIQAGDGSPGEPVEILESPRPASAPVFRCIGKRGGRSYARSRTELDSGANQKKKKRRERVEGSPIEEKEVEVAGTRRRRADEVNDEEAAAAVRGEGEGGEEEVQETEEEEEEEEERDGRGKRSGGGPIRGEYGWGRIPPPSPSRYLLQLSSSPFLHEVGITATSNPPPPLSTTFFLLLHLHLLLRNAWPLLLSEAPAAPGGYPRQVAARDSHGMSGDRYVRPTARISTAEDFHGDFRASTRTNPSSTTRMQ